jgi:transposase-like protein
MKSVRSDALSSLGTRRSENRKSFECKECNADYYENEQGRLKENISREERYNGRGETTVKSAADTTGVSQKTIVQLYQYMRDVCSTKLLNTPPDLGGPGVIGQIDESLFNHKSKYRR